jgi:uncharacterized protein involved in response to NO
MRAALWSSGFRPFLLAGALYAPLFALLWYGARLQGWTLAGGLVPLPLAHAHELLFGFVSAIIAGILLTALPHWAGSGELRGAPIVLLAGLWLAGRAAFHAMGVLPLALVMVLDCALVPALIGFVIPTLARARRRLFWWTLPPLAGLAGANIAFYAALARGSPEDMSWALLLGVHATAFLYALYGGLLTPAFTRKLLSARGEPAAAILVPLEYATAMAMVVFALAELSGASGGAMALAAFGACALHAWRFLRWRGWRTASAPLIWSLHAGYAWLIVAFALRGAAELTGAVPREAWIHAFVLGALGLTMAGLMTRVVLRHTGRPPHVPRAMRLAFLSLFLAALLRLAYSLHPLESLLGAAVLLWAIPFLVYLSCHGAMLLAPSLPGSAASQWDFKQNER